MTITEKASAHGHDGQTTTPSVIDSEVQKITELSAKLENPLSGFSTQELIHQAQEFCQTNGLIDQGQSVSRSYDDPRPV